MNYKMVSNGLVLIFITRPELSIFNGFWVPKMFNIGQMFWHKKTENPEFLLYLSALGFKFWLETVCLKYCDFQCQI